MLKAKISQSNTARKRASDNADIQRQLAEKCWKVVMKNRQKAVGLRHVERMYQHSFFRATLLRGQNENMCIIILAKLFN